MINLDTKLLLTEKIDIFNNYSKNVKKIISYKVLNMRGKFRYEWKYKHAKI